MKGYKKCADADFAQEARATFYKHQRGEDQRTADQLMVHFEQIYSSAVLNDEWDATNADEERIVALQARIAQLERARAPRNQRNNNRGGDTPANQGNNQGNNGNPARNNGTIRRRTFTGADAWRNTPPIANSPHTKTVAGTEWHWCAHHAYWCKHKTEECRDAPRATANAAQAEAQDDEGDLTAAMAAVGIEDVHDE